MKKQANKQNTNVGDDTENLELLCTAGGNVTWYNIMNDPAIPQ
jgi:hypothetical protein